MEKCHNKHISVSYSTCTSWRAWRGGPRPRGGSRRRRPRSASWPLPTPRIQRSVSGVPPSECTARPVEGRYKCTLCGVQSVAIFWNIPPDIGLTLQLLCSQIGNPNFRKKTRPNITAERMPHSVDTTRYENHREYYTSVNSIQWQCLDYNSILIWH